MDRLTENKAWCKPQADIDFRLKESQRFRGMVSIMVLNNKFAWSSVSLHAVER